jgi:hypothetical protein
MDRQFSNIVPLINHYNEGVMSRDEFEHYRELFLEMAQTAGGIFWTSSENYLLFENLIQNLRET